MILTALLMMLGGIGGAYFAAKAAISFSSDLRSDVFGKVQKFSFANLDQFSTGSLVTRLTNDITQVQNLINMALRMMLRAPGMLIGALIMAFVMNAQLALVVLVVMPILVLLIALVIRVAFPRFEIMQKKLDTLNSTIQEMLINVRVIKSFVRGSYEEERFVESNKELKRVQSVRFPGGDSDNADYDDAHECDHPWNCVVRRRQILAGDMPVGDLTAFTSYIVQILMSLMMLSMVFLQSARPWPP